MRNLNLFHFRELKNGKENNAMHVIVIVIVIAIVIIIVIANSLCSSKDE